MSKSSFVRCLFTYISFAHSQTVQCTRWLMFTDTITSCFIPLFLSLCHFSLEFRLRWAYTIQPCSSWLCIYKVDRESSIDLYKVYKLSQISHAAVCVHCSQIYKVMVFDTLKHLTISFHSTNFLSVSLTQFICNSNESSLCHILMHVNDLIVRLLCFTTSNIKCNILAIEIQL